MRHARAWWCACALTLAAGAQSQDRAAREAALQASVVELPRAPQEAWRGRWEDPAAWPEGLAQAYGAVLRADLQRGDVLGAYVQARALLVRHPDFPPLAFELGVLAFRLQRYGDGVSALERFLAQAPEEVGRTRVLGHCLYSLGRTTLALGHYDRVLAARPDDDGARLGRALCLWRGGDPARALEQLDAVLAHDPDHVDAAYWRARIPFDEDLDGDAVLLAAARRAAALAPFEARAQHLLADVEQALGEPDAARAARERARVLGAAAERARALEERLAWEPDAAGLWSELAATWLAAGDVARAAAARERAEGARR